MELVLGRLRDDEQGNKLITYKFRPIKSVQRMSIFFQQDKDSSPTVIDTNHDATGVRIKELPAAPIKLLKGLKSRVRE
jgi:hypothetical protein